MDIIRNIFFFSNEAIQHLFTVNSLSSSMVDTREKGKNEYLDFLGVIDANIGANKINYYMKRTIEQKVTLTEKGQLELEGRRDRAAQTWRHRW